MCKVRRLKYKFGVGKDYLFLTFYKSEENMEKMIVVSESVLIVDQTICDKNTLFQLSIRKYIIDKIQNISKCYCLPIGGY